MKVYHGSTLDKYETILDGDFKKVFPGLYVTDTLERAMIYANAQATGIVDPNASKRLAKHAVIIEIEIDEVRWFKRSSSHNTLDKCEAIITAGKVVAIHKQYCDYEPCWCHR